MAQAALRPAVRGPTFIRLLARLAEVDVTASRQPLPDRLGQWLDWKHALALAAALDSHPTVPAEPAPATDDLSGECAREREVLTTAIKTDPLLAPDAPATDEPDFAPYRHIYLTRQRAMQAAVGRLRGKLRDALLQRACRTDAVVPPHGRHSRFRGNDGHEVPDVGSSVARLAEVDAVMEVALTPREHALLAKVPELLGQRFARLRTAGHGSNTWLDAFRRDMQSVLLAELDLRFQPVDALLAALRTHQESPC